MNINSISNQDEQKYQYITLYTDNNVCYISLNRSEAKNAINHQLSQDLKSAIQYAESSNKIKVIVLNSAINGVFSVGADLKYLQSLQNSNTKQDFLNNWDCLAQAKKPIIASINGYALGGGCELSLMCDIIIASSESWFSQPEIKVGLMPGAGGTQRLARVVGKAQAMDICLSARSISAFEALNMGIISRVVDADKLSMETTELAKQIANYPMQSLLNIKKSILFSLECSLNIGLNIERTDFYNQIHTDAAKEGVDAFVNKREPHFFE